MNLFPPFIRIALILFCTAAITMTSNAQIKRDAGYDARMAWFREARLGMFIHFGLYSTAAGEWDGKPVGFAEYFGFRNPADWKTLLGEFNPTEFDADEIVLAAKDAGMKYLIVTSKHHDGFCLFDSKHTDFDVMSTPFKRDIIKELAEACRKHGLRFGFYYSIIDLHHPDYLPRPGFDPRPAEGADFERYVQFMKDQLRELLTNYGPIDVVWFDGEWESSWTHERAIDMWKYLREIDPDVLINNRIDKGRQGMQGMNRADHYLGDYGTPEQELLKRNPGQDWETCQTMNRHGNWGWRKDEANYYSQVELIQQVITCASLGGNMLLNIGPKDDGTIPQPQQDRLAAIGRWMKANSSSIYGSGASPFTRAPAWGRTTTSGNMLYCHVFDRPESGVLTLPQIDQRAVKAWLLGDPKQAELAITPTNQGGLQIDLASIDQSIVIPVIAVRFEKPPTAPPFYIVPAPDGSVKLLARDAEIDGSASYNTDQQSISNWTDPKTSISWPIKVEPGRYRVEVTYGCTPADQGGTYAIQVGDQRIEATAQSSGGWFDRRTDTIGQIKFDVTDVTDLKVQIVRQSGVAVFDFQSIQLHLIAD